MSIDNRHKLRLTMAVMATILLMAGIVFAVGHFVPRTDGVENLGTSSKEWGIVYSKTNICDVATVGESTSTGRTIVGTDLNLTAGTQTLANGSIITNTASYMRIDTGGETTTTDATTAIVDGTTAGDILVIENIGTNDFVIKNAANTLMSGDRTMAAGLNSTTSFIWNGSDWVGTCESDN